MTTLAWALAVLTAGQVGDRPAVAADGPALISREVFFGNPDRALVRVSPDGKHLAYLAAKDGVMNVFVAPAADLAKARAVTDEKTRGIRSYFWAGNSRNVLYLQDKGGDENWKVMSVDLETGKAIDLTPIDSIPGPDGKPLCDPGGRVIRPSATVEGVSDKAPDEIVIGLNSRSPAYRDLHRVNVRTGESRMILENSQQFAGFVVGSDLTPVVAMAMTPEGGARVFRLDQAGQGTEILSVGLEDSATTSPLKVTADGSTLYLSDSRGRNTAALVAMDLATGKTTVLAEDARADVGRLLVHPTRGRVQAVEVNYDRSRWTVLDSAIRVDLDYLKRLDPGEMQVVSRSTDDSTWVVAYTQDAGPVKFYLYDRKTRKATMLFTNRASLEGLKLAPMQARVIRSRDNLDLVSYLTLPVDAVRSGEAKPERPLPLVLMVHGGPWARDAWGYNAYHQWLANRGYAVLSVNFRGSTGFGKNFVNAGNREWAGRMHEDLIDATEWAIREGIADRDRMAIMGGSYGGYATLVGLAFTPRHFACGVDIVGPSNLVTLLESIPPYWAPLVETFAKRVGDHRTVDGRVFLESRSPVNFADKIVRPLLIGQGANDPRVKQAESDQIVSALQGKHVPVTYVLFPDEGHGFARPENSMAFNAITEAFLAQHLGGRVEPIGDSVKRSTAQVPSGAEHIPGLSGHD